MGTVSNNVPQIKGPAPGSALPFDPNNNKDANGNLPEYAVMILMIECLSLHKDNLSLKADQLQGNADQQNYWEQQIQNIHDVVPPVNASNAELQHDNAINQANSNTRSNYEDMLITQRQQAHILMAESSQETNEVQQAASVVSFVLKTYLSEGDQIVKIDGRNS